ncbi:MAG TPA: hypothetical protein VGZ93_07950 [Candidatus Methylacidiphilales bacterium]|jgi:hypothetical protein|nr:hypothetical protein [Candidatus Methylacidiphilales bacterium]
MFRPIWLLLVVPILLTACAPSAQQEADYAVVRSSPVSPAIYDKMVHGDPLSVSDIAALGQAHVNDGIIIRYIRDHGTIYYLAPPDIDYLQKSGVSQSVIDYMVQTAPPGPPGGPYPVPVVGVGVIFGPSWHHWH